MTILEDAGFKVDTAENGAVALKKLQSAGEGYYAAVLMDIRMPVMNGHLAKPIDTKKLLKMLEEILDTDKN